MNEPGPTSIILHFSKLEDPRVSAKNRHNLLDIVVISVCAVICHAEDWVSVEQFGRAKESWFKQFLELPNGIPSHDTFSRVFSLISPTAFQACFVSWVRSLSEHYEGLIAIDGKTLRRSHDRRNNKEPIHMVSAWAVDNKLVLGQVKTDEKSNEITAIPELLKLLAVDGCIVTIDAMGCQKNIAKQIVEQGGDYVLALKGNQSGLLDQVMDAFETAENVGFEGYEMVTCATTDKGHGREERRDYHLLSCEGLLNNDHWAGLSALGAVESQRTVKGKTSTETRYFISSAMLKPEEFAHAVRGHWSVENELHWTLDVAFREDESRVRKGYGAENLAVLRHIAVNAAKAEKTIKIGVKNKRLRAGWDEPYLAKILLGI